jgi:hypothetical protein
LSQTEVNRFGTPSLITRNTNDVQQVQMVVLLALTAMIMAPILAIGVWKLVHFLKTYPVRVAPEREEDLGGR